MTEVHVFNHHAMATQFQVRVAGGEKKYAAQAAHAAFAVAVQLESLLSRFRENSEISQIAQLAPGESLRLAGPAFACLEIAERMEAATNGAFSVTAAALKTQPEKPRWKLFKEQFSILCESGKLEFDLGAIGKGFALDRMAEVLREWDCPAYLVISGGSSILAGEAPSETTVWSCGLGDDNSPQRYSLKNVSISGSGLAVQGAHILDPRTSLPATLRNRVWALANTAAESDALSTACMILTEAEIRETLARDANWLVFLNNGETWRALGERPLPPPG